MKLIVLFAKINICFLHESKLKSLFVFQELCLLLSIMPVKGNIWLLLRGKQLSYVSHLILNYTVLKSNIKKIKKQQNNKIQMVKSREDALHNTIGVEQITVPWK